MEKVEHVHRTASNSRELLSELQGHKIVGILVGELPSPGSGNRSLVLDCGYAFTFSVLGAVWTIDSSLSPTAVLTDNSIPQRSSIVNRLLTKYPLNAKLLTQGCAPGQIRTGDLHVSGASLFPLSYGGIGLVTERFSLPGRAAPFFFLASRLPATRLCVLARLAG